MSGRILVIDDEAGIRESLRMILEYEGYTCLLAATGEEGLAMARTEAPDLVFSDIKMPGLDGLEVLTRLKAQDESLPVVMISGHGTVATAVEATKLGAMDFIEKPLSTERVLLTVRNALNASRLEQENRRLRGAEDARYNIVGQSPALLQVLDAIGRAAPTNATVLVLGESGVGKELVARAIHRNSLRSRERFVQVNCAAIPEELIESELFGHEKGSFTGATDKQIGKFELADRGTIFLDEVGDMSQKTQAKVLRVLQEGEVERIGSQRTLKVDVRVIAATNKDLEAAIGEGTFREDLYFRLSVIPVHVPPLRERPEDIPLLVKHFADLFAADGGRTRRFTPDALGVLQQHRWRGNIRELKNTIERVLIMARGDVVDVPDVRQFLRVEGRRWPSSPPARPAVSPPAPAPPLPTSAARSRRIRRAAVAAAGASLQRRRTDAGECRRAPRRQADDAARVQGAGRARVPRREAARARVEHLADRRGHRHAAQQPLQEARAVRDQPGEATADVTRRFKAVRRVADMPTDGPDSSQGDGQVDADTTDYYELLQISPNADPDTVTRVFRLLARRYHPDQPDTGNEEKFREILAAYAVLSDPEKRAHYDVNHVAIRRERWRFVAEGAPSAGDYAAEHQARLVDAGDPLLAPADRTAQARSVAARSRRVDGTAARTPRVLLVVPRAEEVRPPQRPVAVADHGGWCGPPRGAAAPRVAALATHRAHALRVRRTERRSGRRVESRRGSRPGDRWQRDASPLLEESPNSAGQCAG